MSDRDNGTTIRSGTARFARLRKAFFGLTLAAAAVTIFGLKLEVVGSAHDHSEDADARHAVEDLVTCYSLGTDAIGRAVNAADNQPLDSTVNLTDPNFAAGLAYYRDCFTKDFTFMIKNPETGVVIVTVPDPATRTPDTDAALQWANFVNNSYRPNYKFTQHAQSTTAVVVKGKTAVTQSYLHSTHVYGPTAPSTGIQYIIGTYTNQDVKVRGKWLIKTRTLEILSSVHVPAGL